MSENTIQKPTSSTIAELHRTHAIEVKPEMLQSGDIVCYYNYYCWIHEKTEIKTKFKCSVAKRPDSWPDSCLWFCHVDFSFGKIEKICSVDETGRIII